MKTALRVAFEAVQVPVGREQDPLVQRVVRVMTRQETQARAAARKRKQVRKQGPVSTPRVREQ